MAGDAPINGGTTRQRPAIPGRQIPTILNEGAKDGSLVDMGDALYDGGLLLDDDGLTIRRYYFPFAGPKRIPYAAVRHVRSRPMGWLTGKGRGWGTAHPGYWLPLDLRRAGKHTLLTFDLGRRVKPCVTPDDPNRVMQLLQGRVPVD
jgi:hypothetical protein